MRNLHDLHHTVHRQVHHRLKLQPHRHTGRVLHHRHTSYRGLAVVFVLAGMTMFGLAAMQRAAADTLLGVSGIVPVPVPHTAALISTPTDGAVVQSSDVLVAGNCPIVSPALTVVVLMDNAIAGSALCSASNNFALPVHLTPGSHELVTRVYTITGGQGPSSPATRLAYQTKAAGAAAGASDTPNLVPADPFDIVGPDNTAAWSGEISGGTAPYRVTIDWGDGQRGTYTTADAQLQYGHQYKNGSSHSVTLAVADAGGHFAQQQYAAVNYLAVMNAPAALLSTPAASGSPGARTLIGLYGLYITVLAGSGIIWIEAKHAARHQAVDVPAAG